MTDIAAAPFSLKDAVFVIEAAEDNNEREYTGTVGHVLFAPDVQTVTESYAFSSGVADTFPVGISWTLALEYPQDWSDASALSLYLALHAGQARTVRFEPKAGGLTVRARVTLVPGPIGGQAGPILTGIVVMGLHGQPQLLDEHGDVLTFAGWE